MEEKECTVCGIVKPIEDFYSQKKHSKNRGDYIYYNPECKECTKGRMVKWVSNNRDYYLDKKKYYNRNPTDNTKEIWKQNAQRQREEGYQKQYQQENKDKFKKYRIYREMHKKHEITKYEWESCKQYFNYQCAYCGIDEQKAKELQNNYLHKEHVDPNGSNDLSNNIPACKSCNSRKYKIPLEEWYTSENEAYSEQRLNKITQWLTNDYKLYIENKSNPIS